MGKDQHREAGMEGEPLLRVRLTHTHTRERAKKVTIESQNPLVNLSSLRGWESPALVRSKERSLFEKLASEDRGELLVQYAVVFK